MAERTAAFDRFMKSMDQSFESFVFGCSYDLDAIDALSSNEKREIEALLISKREKMRWDIDALKRFRTPSAIAAIEEACRTGSTEIRLASAEYLHSIGRIPDLSDLICASLTSEVSPATGYACDLAIKFPSAKIEEALLSTAWKYPTQDRAWTCMGALLTIRGESYDSHRWYKLYGVPSRFRRSRCRAEIKKVCARIGIDWTRLLSAKELQSRTRRQRFIVVGYFVGVLLFAAGMFYMYL